MARYRAIVWKSINNIVLKVHFHVTLMPSKGWQASNPLISHAQASLAICVTACGSQDRSPSDRRLPCLSGFAAVFLSQALTVYLAH